MLSLNTSPQRQPIGMNGSYPPTAYMGGYSVINAMPWSDGVSTTHGFFAPLNYDSTTQAIINTSVLDTAGMFAADDGTYSQDEEKRFVAMNYYNGYKAINKLLIGREPKPVGTFTTATTADKGRITGFGDDRFVFVRTDGGNVKIQCGQMTADNTLVYGAEETIGAGTDGACAVLDSGNVVVAFLTTNTIKSVVVGISGTTCTVGSVHTTAITNADNVYGVAVVDTNKMVVGYRLQTSAYPAVYASSISAGAFTDGSAVTLNATAASWDFAYDKCLWKMDTNRAAFFVEQSTSCYVHYVSVSGTTVTDNGECTIVAGAMSSSHKVFATNNRAVLITPSTNSTVIRSIGWMLPANSVISHSINLTGNQAYAVLIVETGQILLVMYNNASSVYTLRFYGISVGINSVAVTSTSMVVSCPAYNSFYANTFADKAWLMHVSTSNGLGMLGATMDFEVNGSAVATSEKVNVFDLVTFAEPVNGRTAYLSITNKETYSTVMRPYMLFANVE